MKLFTVVITLFVVNTLNAQFYIKAEGGQRDIISLQVDTQPPHQVTNNWNSHFGVAIGYHLTKKIDIEGLFITGRYTNTFNHMKRIPVFSTDVRQNVDPILFTFSTSQIGGRFLFNVIQKEKFEFAALLGGNFLIITGRDDPISPWEGVQTSTFEGVEYTTTYAISPINFRYNDSSISSGVQFAYNFRKKITFFFNGYYDLGILPIFTGHIDFMLVNSANVLKVPGDFSTITKGDLISLAVGVRYSMK